MTPVAERVLDYFGDHGVERGFVRVYAPEPTPGHEDWRCAFRLTWPGYDSGRHAIGVDAWQALQLAMYAAPHWISATEDFKAQRIGLWGTPVTTYDDICDLFGVKCAGPENEN